MPDIFVAKKKAKPKTRKKAKAKKKKRSFHKPPPLAELKDAPGFTKNPLASFSYYPKKVQFVGKDSKEHIVLLLRRHPITNVRWIIIALLMIFTPFILSYLPLLEFLPQNYQIISLLAWYLITTAFIIEEFLGWYFNVYIITDERIFDVDFINLVYREISEANLDQIQDVTVQVGSVLRTLFNYGNIVIQTASEIPQIEFEAVPKPDMVAKILRELRVEEEIEKIEGRVR